MVQIWYIKLPFSGSLRFTPAMLWLRRGGGRGSRCIGVPRPQPTAARLRRWCRQARAKGRRAVSAPAAV